jgi:glucosamine--fructose-6-phosphate aminotransferase (isomerizing)
MCGIIGIISKENVADEILSGLRRLEYRGYDSAGIATVHNGEIHRRRKEGKIKELADLLEKEPLEGVIGIGHTRWATHGAPITNNAHPHTVDGVAVVHNGIIENYLELREELEALGYSFTTDTDTEVIPVLLSHFMKEEHSLEKSLRRAVERLEGAYAVGAISAERERILAVKKGSPLVIGYGDGEMFIASDALALSPLTTKVSYLEEGDIAALTADSVVITDKNGEEVEREIVESSASTSSAGKENYPHFMLKEIYEQPKVLGETLSAYYNSVNATIILPEYDFDLSELEWLTVVACGTSFYAGMTAKYWMEKMAKIPVQLDIASEYRYREAPFPKKGAALFISQSGETADTLAAMRYAKENGQYTIAVVNVAQSTMAREADLVLKTYAGPEIGVASTKAFVTQLMTLACFTLAMAQERGHMDEAEVREQSHALSTVPARISEVLQHDDEIKKLAQNIQKSTDVLFIGRSTSFPIALEGALKLKEISYLHAEANAAGELKHGSIALVDEDVPIICIAPSDHIFDKMASNIREVAARDGRIILLSDEKGCKALKDVTETCIVLPKACFFTTPMLYAVPVQLLAYHVAVAKGTDVDQPRNLAKSVTVE